jgi:hypothetical protein
MAGGISSLGMIAPIDLEIASTVFTFSGEPQFSGIRQIALQGASLAYELNPTKRNTDDEPSYPRSEK